ncbi:MAG: histone deacetylase [Armatimonadota bacterium]|jgi:acetoin utilization deacetylase AcuC-like enzyme
MPCPPKTILVFAAALLLAAPTAIHGQTTGFVYHEAYLDHDTGGRHPETPERLRAIVAHLEQTGLMKQLRRIRPSPAALEALTAIHTEEYVAEVQRACREGQAFLHSSDTPICLGSYRAALLAAGGVLSAIDAIMAGDVRNAFCAVRPPGHHAVEDRAMGFCLFNNVAVGVRYAQSKHNLRKILIVDWDVHHGNATQAAFYDDPDVLYFSVHQYPFYPGTGAASETGAGRGEGSTLNAPLPAGSGDSVYERVFEDILKPRALAFAPDLVIISAGFDGHEDDLLGSMQLSTEGYAKLTRMVRDIAERCCSGRIVSVLEGGYNLEALAASVASHVSALLEDD